MLHTWTTTLAYHPHVHLLVPAGAVSPPGEWAAARKDYLVPVNALGLIFRGMFLEMLHKALPQQGFPNSVWSKPWVVYCKPTVPGTERVLQYLARYVHRVAFANSRLVRIDNPQVTFRYQDRRRQQWDTMTVPAEEFLRRFLQHVLPRGTPKVRYYGFWNPSRRPLLRRIQRVTGTAPLPDHTQQDPTPPTEALCSEPFETRPTCPGCSEGLMVLVRSIRRSSRPPP